MATIEAGTYKWKDNPSNFVDGTADALGNLVFISNNTSYTGIFFTELDPETGEFWEICYSNENILAYGSSTWLTKYQTITFESNQTVDETAYDWLITQGNLVKQTVETITDLTGYTWVGNDTLGFPAKVTYNLNFTTTFTDPSTSQVDTFNAVQLEFSTTKFGSMLSYVNILINSLFAYNWSVSEFSIGWQDPLEKTIQITGGTDATNSDLIEWLQANGNLIKQTEVNPNVVSADGLLTAQTLVATNDISWISNPNSTFTTIWNDYTSKTWAEMITLLGIDPDEFTTDCGTSVDITAYEKLSVSRSMLAVSEAGHLSIDLSGELSNVILSSPQLQGETLNATNILAIVIDSATGRAYAYELSAISGDTATIPLCGIVGMTFFIKNQTLSTNSKIMHANREILSVYAGTKPVKTIYKGSEIIYNK